MKLTTYRRNVLRQIKARRLKQPENGGDLGRQLDALEWLYEQRLITWSLDDPERPTRLGRLPRLTELGERVLNPPVAPREQRPVFSAWARDPYDYTTDFSRADKHAGDVIDPEITDRYARRAREKQIEQAESDARDRELLTLEERMVAARKAANVARISLRDEFRLLHKARREGDDDGVVRHLYRIERKTYRNAA